MVFSSYVSLYGSLFNDSGSIESFRVFLAEFSFDILGTNKTKLDDSIKSSELHIPGYEFIRRDRNRHGGGVGFYISLLILI